MSDLQEQRELERRLSEAIALAQSIVEKNSRENSSTNSNNESSAATADDDTVDSKREPGPHRRVNKTSCKLVWKIVFAISVFAVLVCVGLAVRYVRGHNRSLRAENRLRTYVDRGTDTSDGSESAEGNAVSGQTTNGNYPELDVNFDGLKTQNGDICAWIYIPGTDVDYPVLQGSDNAYYLNHDAYGEYSPDGSIFVDAGNNLDFEDFDTIIYGHNMSTGTMFKTLHNYEDDSFWESNRNVYIYLPDRVMRYEVFAAYRTNDRHILTYNDFSDKEVRKEYLLNIKSERFDEGIVKNDQNIDIDSRLLTLSTCCGMDGKRWLVQAVKIDEIPVENR